MEKFSSRLPAEISAAKTEISVTVPAGFSYGHIDIFTKKRVVTRDLGNRASPVDWAHMKRPQEPFHISPVAGTNFVVYSCGKFQPGRLG